MAEIGITLTLENPVEPFQLQQAINKAVWELLQTQDRRDGHSHDTTMPLQGIPTIVTIWDTIQFDLTTLRIQTEWTTAGDCTITATATPR